MSSFKFLHFDIVDEFSAQWLRCQNLAEALQALGHRAVPIRFTLVETQAKARAEQEVLLSARLRSGAAHALHSFFFQRTDFLRRRVWDLGRRAIEGSHDWRESFVVFSYPTKAGLSLLRTVVTREQWRPRRIIADLADPIVDRADIRLNPVGRAMALRFERFVVSRSDYIFVTTSSYKDVLLRRYPGTSHKIILVPQAGKVGREAGDLRFGYLYTGTFYETIRNPHNLLSAIRELGERLTVIGPVPSWVRHNRELVDWVGVQNYDDTLRSIRAADVTILLDNEPPSQLPGKIFDYLLNAKRKVVFITSRPRLPSEIGGSDCDVIMCRNAVSEIKSSLVSALKSERHNIASGLDWHSRARAINDALGL